MSEAGKEKTYSEAEINTRLAAELPRWTYANNAIRRTCKTAGWKGTLMVVNTIGHLSEAAWHHPDLLVSYSSVEITLWTHTAKGITDKDFELARKIEDVIFWQPGKEGGALEGTPKDARFAYIDYGA
jgi:4a-hydroxytetrahydrobiopterin dehydratase